ncbi:Spermatogenesis-associated protein 20 [Fulvia fulva]|uniref:Spermatogenesis-associated protein 20 n=1 Tax=Passalora fulva TaxID=5499 RepID=A0A9Q8P581_PASFU|nr:Spermatogenesis-associated protein 20 [Fulvia fulva]KAK4630929.1 Spermatogenesis-associated protein 20 [Fulvia fulva]KAK4633220.1 Spermatogenesis-associated protein 20 [Fulvia fulva]UJO13738.1 Spermatogenesis-associated protein 20 [Fulvia fulva]WPV11497.1 Spermatogenesis-associated protein 20 [Fulvia fulva]WPV26891.1 Spermatogenesis-associated protein 20 [Fulvia fulva]
METARGPDRAVSLTNRCGESKSPYVRSHIDNPTAWQLWTPETLELARQTNRLIFVSIGYSACHWCHVMAHESFDDPRIAQLLNEHFVPIKIDREERRDIDRQYMDFLQATSGGGGWPLNVFVTPDLEPIFGGTYWPGPKSERAQMGGTTFEHILLKVSRMWKEQEARLRASGKEITKQLREFAQEGHIGGRDGKGDDNDGLELDLLDDAFQHYKKRYDRKFGGFGAAPKFPTPVHLKPLLRVAAYPKDVREIVGEDESIEARAMAVKSLENIAKGGIKDQIGHGFARYSVTRDWSLPHFEKMLYDNAQLLPVYLEAYMLTKSLLFLETTHDIAKYLTSAPMASELGGICSAEDADSLPTAVDHHKREGAYYVWTMDEFKKILTEAEVQVCATYWGMKSDGNIDTQHDIQGELVGQNTLCVQYEPAELAKELNMSEDDVKRVLADGRQKLLAYREKNRPRPALDDKIVTSWNGLAVGGLARAGAALDVPEYIAAAEKAVHCIRTQLFDENARTLRRVYREGPGETQGFADDYAFLISGLLDLYESTFDSQWLEFADILQQTQTKLFWDAEKFGFFSTPANQPDILIRTKDAMDNAEPSVNGVSAMNLFRLGSLLSDEDYEKMGKRTVAAFDVEIGQHPGLFSGILGSVVASKMGMKGVMVVGDGEVADIALQRAREQVRPNHTIVRVGGGAKSEWLQSRNGLLKALDSTRRMVQLCDGGVCRILNLKEVKSLFDA